MGILDLSERLNWEQAARLLCVSKSAFFRLVAKGVIPAHGRKETNRWYLRSECLAYLELLKLRKKHKR